MKLGTKITAATAIVVITTVIAMVFTVNHVSNENRVEALKNQMSTIISQSEDVAANMDKLYNGKAFDIPGLIASAKEQAGSRSLKEAYSETVIYRSIPIVAAWKSVENSAANAGFDFFIPSHPNIVARNPKNNIGANYREAFDAFEKGETEYFKVDEEKNRLILARPVKLQASCLSCHGNPAQSITGNGLDPLGFPMEDLKVGTIKGAFVLEAPLKDDKVMADTMSHMALIGLIVVIVMMGGFYLFSDYAIIKPLAGFLGLMKNSSEQTTSAASQIANASQSLASGSSEQAASLEETSASLEELTSMTRRNAENAGNGSEEMKRTRAAAEKSSSNMSELSAAMHEMSKIVKSIDEIAFQTNILALNAAVEAARAGEAGMGFAVVADEVRNLAKRSADAAHETATKIEQSVTLTQRVEGSLNEVVDQARKVDQLITDIATASKEQSTGLDQINIAVTQMDKVTQNTASSSEETASAAEELSAQAKAMEDELRKLMTLVGETKASAPTYSPPKVEVKKPNTRVNFATKVPISRAERLAATPPPTTLPSLPASTPPKTKSTGSIPMPDMNKDFEDFH